MSLRHVKRLLNREEVVVAGVRGESVFEGVELRLFVVRLWTPAEEIEELDLVAVEERFNALRNRSLNAIASSGLVFNLDIFQLLFYRNLKLICAMLVGRVSR